MKKREIKRVAFLQNYEGMHEKLICELDEIVSKGYPMIILSAMRDLPGTLKVAEEAVSRGLQVGLFTGYMKYDYKYLAENPEQQMVFAQANIDQDGLSTSGWGCPFNVVFKTRYFDKLRELAMFPGVVHIDLNDEAYMGHGCYCDTCKAEYEEDIGGEMPCKPDPQPEDWEDPRWREYLLWRMKRWNAVHSEMADVIRDTDSAVRVSFQTSPAVDMWENPWHSAVDLAAMGEFLDQVCTDPYYTFHRRIFDPPEVYLSEWCRFLYGIMPKGKTAAIIPQGFSHPIFTRPLGEADGAWSAIVPPACGVNFIAPYTYTLQRCSPVLKTYEESWQKLDPIFEETLPMKYAGVVHGIQTEILRYPLPLSTPESYDGTRMFPVAESLRHAGTAYGFLSDAKLSDVDALNEHRVVVCPEISCISREQQEGLRSFVQGGGNAVILGELGVADEQGGEQDTSLLSELFGIEARGRPGRRQNFAMTTDHSVLEKIVHPDKAASERYMDGTGAPLYQLAQCRDIVEPADGRVLAEFCDEHGASTGKPAILSFDQYGGEVLYFAGFPARTARNTIYGTTVRNLAHQLFARLTEWVAGPTALRVDGWPSATPIGELRPLDQRFMPTFEFFPLEGDDFFLGVVTSYFREPTEFPMVLTVPEGREVTGVQELVFGADVPVSIEDGQASINVELTFDTPALVYRFDLV